MHEMDAIRCREWRILPMTYFLNEKWGFIVFVMIHIPLFFVILFFLMKPETHHMWRTGLNYFYMVHFGLHLLLLLHQKNEFKDWVSWFIISGAAIFGFLDLFFAI